MWPYAKIFSPISFPWLHISWVVTVFEVGYLVQARNGVKRETAWIEKSLVSIAGFLGWGDKI